jgi:hypothetical protein
MVDVEIVGLAFNLCIERQVYIQYVPNVVEIRVRLAAPLARSITGGLLLREDLALSFIYDS